MNLLKLVGDFNVKKANHRSEISTTRRVSTVVDEKTSFLVREAYNATRTNIVYSLASEQGGKVIIITSASPHEGKTTTCLNLAVTFAQTEAKVLVIDADLRKPRINRHLMLDRQDGLSDVLCGLIPVEKAIKHCEKQGLDCITSGQIPPNPTELLSSSGMKEMIDALREKYDYIFIDTPPVTVVTEAAAMTEYSSGVILVVRQNSTVHEAIKRAKKNLDMANAKLLGFVLNGISASSYGYGSGYSRYSYKRTKGYNYGYGYGYGKNGYGYGYGYGYGDYGYGYGYGDYADRPGKSKGEKAPKKQSLFGKKNKKEEKVEQKADKKQEKKEQKPKE